MSDEQTTDQEKFAAVRERMAAAKAETEGLRQQLSEAEAARQEFQQQTADQPAPLALTTTTGVSQVGTTLGVSEAAARLGKAEKTVRRMLAKGELEGAAKVPGPAGDTWQIPLAAVESHLAAQQGGRVPGQGTGQGAAVSRVAELEREVVELRHQVELRDMQLAEKERYLQTLEALTSRMLPPAPTKKRWWSRTKATPPTN